MNGENNFGNNNGNQFGFNNNPNDMNNQNNFNQGMQPNTSFNNGNSFNQGMQSNPEVNNMNNFNQGMPQNPAVNNMNNFNQGMPQNSGINNMNNFNQGMPQNPAVNNMNNFNQEMPQNSGINNMNNFNQGMPQNSNVNQGMPVNGGYNPAFGNVANNGMNPNINPMNPNMNQMPMGGYGPNNTSNNNQKNTIVGIGAFVGIVAIVLVLVVVGFKVIGGGKTLTCELSQSSYGLEMKMVDEIKYKKKGKSTEKITITLSKDGGFTDEEYAKLEDSFEDTFGDVDDDDFVVKPKITRKGEKVEVTGTTKEDFEDKTFDELKKELEEDGYTCK